MGWREKAIEQKKKGSCFNLGGLMLQIKLKKYKHAKNLNIKTA